MKIRVARKDELEQVNKIAKQVHEMHVEWRPDIFINVEDVIQKETFETLIENEQIYVIVEKNQIVGYSTINIKEKDTHGIRYRKILEINAIGIDRNYRGKGLGTELINYIINLRKEKECTDLYLTVNEENTEAIKVYEKIGMKVKNIAYSMRI